MTCETCASERESRLRAERERDEARALLAWAQGCVVRAAHGLALALKGKGLDGANLFDNGYAVMAVEPLPVQPPGSESREASVRKALLVWRRHAEDGEEWIAIRSLESALAPDARPEEKK